MCWETDSEKRVCVCKSNKAFKSYCQQATGAAEKFVLLERGDKGVKQLAVAAQEYATKNN